MTVSEPVGPNLFRNLPVLSCPKVRRLWTPSEIDLLRTAFPAGGFIENLAKQLDRSKAAISCKAYRLGLRRRPCATSTAMGDLLTAPVIQPRRYVVTKMGGIQDVWFLEIIERLERMWFANVHQVAIAAVLGPQFTAMAVSNKAHRLGLLPRLKSLLIKDVETARAIDRSGALLSKTVTDHLGRQWQRRTCALSGIPFWSRHDRISPQAKETRYYQDQLDDSSCGMGALH